MTPAEQLAASPGPSAYVHPGAIVAKRRGLALGSVRTALSDRYNGLTEAERFALQSWLRHGCEGRPCCVVKPAMIRDADESGRLAR